MNYFTKQELQHIQDNIGKGEFSHWVGTPEDFQEIRDKAKAIIENYREHEACGDGAGLEKICKSCNKSSNDGWSSS